jgi:hypothetical protein
MKSLEELVREREPDVNQLVRERDETRFFTAIGILMHGGLEDHLAAFRVRAQIERLPR